MWLTDVAALARSQAVDLMQWSAQALMHAAIDWAPPRSRPIVPDPNTLGHHRLLREEQELTPRPCPDQPSIYRTHPARPEQGKGWWSRYSLPALAST